MFNRYSCHPRVPAGCLTGTRGSGDSSNPQINKKTRPGSGALLQNQSLSFLLFGRGLASGKIFVHLIEDSVEHCLVIGLQQEVGYDAVDHGNTHTGNILLQDTEYDGRQEHESDEQKQHCNAVSVDCTLCSLDLCCILIINFRIVKCSVITVDVCNFQVAII